MQTLAATPELLASICRYVEVKALIGGTTTGQGITLANQSGIRRYFRGVMRNVEATDDDTLPAASTRVPDVAASDAQAFLTRLKKEKTCYLLHLAEGLDATARRAFASLQIAPGQWAITSSLCGIHAAALQGVGLRGARRARRQHGVVAFQQPAALRRHRGHRGRQGRQRADLARLRLRRPRAAATC